MAELPAKDEKQEDEERRDIKKLLKQLRKNRKGEDEAKALLKEMQINLDAAQARSAATELQMSTCRPGKRTVGNDTQTLNLKTVSKAFWTWCNRRGWGRQRTGNTGLKE